MAPVESLWLVTHAEEYASLGWALVQLDGKNPIGYGWQKTEPVDPETAADIWQGRAGANMGLVLGPSGVIDYEMDAGSLTDFLAPLGGQIPQTPAYRTGTGKLHILFRDPGGLSRRTKDGFELRAGPHQSVIPPSIHPDTGKPYEWVNDPTEYPLADPPQALLDFFAVREGGNSETHWREPLRGAKLGEGEGRHASMISFLGRMVNVLESPDELTAAAIAYAELTQDPPYPDHVLEQQALDVWNRYREEQEPGDPDSVDERLGIKSLDRVQMRAVEFFWRPYLQKSAFHLLVGRKGAGKGSFLAWLAAQITIGSETRAPMGVLWISTEDSFEIDVKPRFTVQGGDPKRFLTVNKKVRLPRDLPDLEAACREHAVGLLVIDPIVGVIGSADSNAEGPIVDAIGGLNELADRLDLMVLGVRHLGKNVERGMLEAVLGNVAWVNTPRAVLGIGQEEDSKIVTLQVLAGNRTRSRDSYDFDLVEEAPDGLDEPVSKLLTKGTSQTDIADLMARQPKDAKYKAVREYVIRITADNTPVSKEAVIPEIMAEIGVGKSTLDRVVRDLVEEGQIRWLVPAKDEHGKFVPGAKWYFQKAL